MCILLSLIYMTVVGMIAFRKCMWGCAYSAGMWCMHVDAWCVYVRVWMCTPACTHAEAIAGCWVISPGVFCLEMVPHWSLWCLLVLQSPHPCQCWELKAYTAVPGLLHGSGLHTVIAYTLICWAISQSQELFSQLKHIKHIEDHWG